MQTFEFDNGALNTSVIVQGSKSTGSTSFTDQNVNFTLSVSVPQVFGGVAGGNGTISQVGSNTPSSDFNFLRGIYRTTQTFEDFTITLDVNGGTGATGTPGTQFGGNVAINVTTIRSFTGSVIFSGSNPVTKPFGTGLITATGQFTSIKFTLNKPGADNIAAFLINDIRAEINCFRAGTMITTLEGEKPVEMLEKGDMLRTADGTMTPVRWLGRQPVDTALADPRRMNPIRIRAGALGSGLPKRDLRLSPDHAIAIDGYLINAGALVNGSTIYQERAVREDFTYYHVETDAHELILAEGVAAETFIDYTTRDTFENAEEGPNRVIPEMPLPRISSARLVPEYIKRHLQPVIAAE